ncbi:hypothetical protein BVU76_03965 [Mycolicibacterium porcinum]|nr:hypothetical protein BVU76_03965 [Mycolicibacterium porcinum]
MTSADFTNATTLAQLPIHTQLPAKHLADMGIDTEEPRLVSTPLGTRIVLVATGGRIEGPEIKGEVLPGGSDWVLSGDDGIGRRDVRAVIRTDDGALITYTAGGLIQVPPDGWERLAAGEALTFGQTYLRSTPSFETSDPRYRWISTVVTVGYLLLSNRHVDYRIYTVL